MKNILVLIDTVDGLSHTYEARNYKEGEVILAVFRGVHSEEELEGDIEVEAHIALTLEGWLELFKGILIKEETL